MSKAKRKTNQKGKNYEIDSDDESRPIKRPRLKKDPIKGIQDEDQEDGRRRLRPRKPKPAINNGNDAVNNQLEATKPSYALRPRRQVLQFQKEVSQNVPAPPQSNRRTKGVNAEKKTKVNDKEKVTSKAVAPKVLPTTNTQAASTSNSRKVSSQGKEPEVQVLSLSSQAASPRQEAGSTRDFFVTKKLSDPDAPGEIPSDSDAPGDIPSLNSSESRQVLESVPSPGLNRTIILSSSSGSSDSDIQNLTFSVVNNSKSEFNENTFIPEVFISSSSSSASSDYVPLAKKSLESLSETFYFSSIESPLPGPSSAGNNTHLEVSYASLNGQHTSEEKEYERDNLESLSAMAKKQQQRKYKMTVVQAFVAKLDPQFSEKSPGAPKVLVVRAFNQHNRDLIRMTIMTNKVHIRLKKLIKELRQQLLAAEVDLGEFHQLVNATSTANPLSTPGMPQITPKDDSQDGDKVITVEDSSTGWSSSSSEEDFVPLHNPQAKYRCMPSDVLNELRKCVMERYNKRVPPSPDAKTKREAKGKTAAARVVAAHILAKNMKIEKKN